MFNALTTEFAGCNGKLAFAETRTLQVAAFGNSGRLDSDYYRTDIARDAEVVSSIDKIGRFCTDLNLFATAALNHAFRDVTAALACPDSADICFEFGEELANEAKRLEVVEAVREACSRSEIKLGKCHSVRSAITALTVAARGLRTPQKHASKDEKYGTVYMIGKLGAFREIYLSEMGHSRPLREVASEAMCRSYGDVLVRSAIRLLDAADVSGFGFVGASLSLATRNHIALDLKLPKSVVLDDGVFTNPIQCLTSDLPEGVLIDDCTVVNAVCLREVAGPILLCVPQNERSAIDILRVAEADPVQIGTYIDKPTGALKIEWE